MIPGPLDADGGHVGPEVELRGTAEVASSQPWDAHHIGESEGPSVSVRRQNTPTPLVAQRVRIADDAARKPQLGGSPRLEDGSREPMDYELLCPLHLQERTYPAVPPIVRL